MYVRCTVVPARIYEVTQFLFRKCAVWIIILFKKNLFFLKNCYVFGIAKHSVMFPFLFCFQELVATSGSERNWKGMLIATIVIGVVMGEEIRYF